jgi:hypothetical protein
MVRRSRVLGRVTGVAVRRNGPKHSARVTPGTGQVGMRPGQGEHGMVEGSRRPRRDAVALLTVVRVTLSHVIRSSLIVGLMADVAVRRNGLKRPAGMTLRALQARMAAQQREEVMGESCLLPDRCRVASLTIGRPSIGQMIGRCRPCEVFLVAYLALDRDTAELSGWRSGMAVLARRRDMGAV